MPRFGRPRTVGLACGHCGSRDALHHTTVGIVCLACWRWCTWNGAAGNAWWGDDNPSRGGQAP